MCNRRVKSCRCVKSMNPKNTKKSPIHENPDTNISCDFGDGDISCLGNANQTHVYKHTNIVRSLASFARAVSCLRFYPATSFLAFPSTYSSSRSISSLGRGCPDVSAEWMIVLRHSACCCHRTKRICDVFLPSLSWLSSASYSGYHSLHYCLL